ncbi:LysR substrate-binding domain-containing protein [Frigidibacter sp. MR17.14]|uniref:LysR substrate-binding domain-containing protein n=1 Tax=Frigidibacter sp. MR17.14 TaxID=3126509 RepID=UPI003012EFD1
MRRFLPSLSALQAFEAAGRHGSFTRAAEDMSITQSGVSRQITNLEGFLGVRLFERIGSRIVLTQAGSSYLADITLLLDQIEQASIDTVRGRKLDDRLMIRTLPAFSSRWLTPRLGGFIDAHPGIMVEIGSTEGELNFEDTDTDVAILRGRGSWRGAIAQELFGERIVAVASPRLIPVGEAPAHLDFGAIRSLQNAGRPDLWLTWLRISGQKHSGAIQGPRLPNSDTLISAAIAGLGIAVVPLAYVEAELARGELWAVFGPPVVTEDSFWVVMPERQSQKASAKVFRSWLLQGFRRRVPGATAD